MSTEVERVPTTVDGCWELRLPRSVDRRGSFLKLFQSTALGDLDIDFDVRELFVSRSGPNVVRGFHHQDPPSAVAKLVWCLEGRIADAVVDLRASSPTFREHCLVELSDEHANGIYVPVGCAHGFAVAEGPALVAYAQTGEHDPSREGGVLWSSAGVAWPIETGQAVVSDRDAALPPLDELESPFS